jgi:ATP-binding cassette subfamily B multidrug efflux pump
MVIMMALMLVSMVFVMIIIGRNSAERIVEIVNEQPDIVSPQNPIMSVKDGHRGFQPCFLCLQR